MNIQAQIDRDLQQVIYREKAQELYELWLGSPKATQLGTIDASDFSFIREFLATNYNGIVCVEGLDAAVDAVLVQRREAAEETAKQIALADQIEAYMREHKIAEDDQAIDIIVELQKDPAFSFEKFVTFCELNPHRFNHLVGFRAFSMLDAVRHAPAGQRELRRKYGDAVVDSALAQLQQRIHKGTEQIQDMRAASGDSNRHSMYTQEDAAADKKRREEEFKKNPLFKIQQAQIKHEAESVPFSFRVCIDGNRTDHGATQEGRQILQEMLQAGLANGTPLAELRDQLRAEANRLAGIR